MYAIGQSHIKGKASLKISNGSLQVRLPRELFDGKQKFFSLGLSDTPENRVKADIKLREIQLDIDTDDFDYTLERYRKPHQRQEHLAVVKELYPETTMMDLWDRYLNYKKLSLKGSSIIYLQNIIGNVIQKSKITSPYHALELRKWLLANTTESMAKRVLTNVNAMFKWGMKHKLVKFPNPYEGMPQELKHKYEEEPKANAFTIEQKKMIINGFANHFCNSNGKRHGGQGYNYYTNFVKFMFMTGCRPSEAVGLCWEQISDNFSKISFDRSIYQAGNGKKINNEKSKNNRIRTFPCSLKLQEFLKSIKPETAKPNDLAFPSPTGKPIHYNNFSRRAWDAIVNPIKPGTTPYSCRDTFITEQIGSDIPIAVIAKWVDNSANEIEKRYLDHEVLSHIRPIDF
ncbi:MAG: tyrosine-type recombinase/integrase [Cyanosarcina radialis HA8281-LM2]|jgi:integrase|nr:tyrosine-type recombinase/integrase [Cyanosarcina radialis HA8281-LM2]